MAVDGRKFRDTLRISSDDWIEYPCSPCAKDDKEVAAIKHCVECGQNLCKTCLAYHDKFTSGHQIINNLSSQTEQKKPELPVQRCDKHGGKLVDVYCPGHDAVGCSTCVAVDHSSCKDKQFIPDVVKASPIANEISKLETRMEQLLTCLDKLKHTKQDRCKQLQKEKSSILKEIGNLRKKINDHLDQMEKILVKDTESKLAEKIQSTNQCVEIVKGMNTSVIKCRKILQEARCVNDAEMFVQLKQTNKTVLENESLMKQLSAEGDVRSVKLIPNRVQDILFRENENIFGRISEVIIPKSKEYIGTFNVRLPSDKNKCWIRDCRFTTSGSIVCADNYNNRLKKLDTSCAVIEHLDLPDSPHSLCEVDDTQLAVTLTNTMKVQFVYQQPLKLGSWFAVEDRCRGIDCHNGLIYVCCGGERDEGRGYVAVYDINGGLLKTFYQGLTFPWYIKASNGGDLFVADGVISKILTANKRNFVISKIHIKAVSDVNGFCRIGDGQLSVTGKGSNSIVIISEDGKHQENLLTDNAVLNCSMARAVCFDEKQSRLIVSFDCSDAINEYLVTT